ncbi:UDP-2,3-diacylglucosamine diphosphatase [Porticoccaceae bacterium]|jgi:UDP-2,3-diacylglucosamine hydrolase|nr:UDP-2,3-diacylglucosamine diphosphatase [Porticoccaceae bacterium]MDA9014504.1 UDP-2,3-diacylglucosamine diphosphatase [Porticoccaceae bacterium]
MAILFISDLHLSPERPEVTRAFLTFLQQHADSTEALFVLGDLFEAWIGDDDTCATGIEVQEAFKQLTDKGVGLFIQHGNRDFFIGKRFCKATGANLLADEHLVEYMDETVLVMHGDTLCTDDVDYIRFRKKIRHPVSKALLQLLPLTYRQKLANAMRAKSKAANANKPSAIMDVNANAVEVVMTKHCVSTLIHGHTHRPDRHQHENGERIVLGDWHDKGWYIVWDLAGINLNNFNIEV